MNAQKVIFTRPLRYRDILISVSTGVIAFGVSMLPHTVLLEKCRNLVSLYRLGSEMPVPEELKQRIEETMNDLKLPTEERNMIKPFMMAGADAVPMGTPFRYYGAHLGIPLNFTYKNRSMIDTSRIYIDGELINSATDEGKDFLDGLILSPNAQRYAISRAILRLRTYDTLINALIAGTITGIVTILQLRYNNYYFKSLKESRRRLIQCCTISFSIFFGVFLWSVLTLIYSALNDISIDQQLAQMGSAYVEGGLEFHQQFKKRNIAIWRSGKKSSTEDGEPNTLFWKGVSIAEKIEFFESKLKEIKSEENTTKELQKKNDNESKELQANVQ